ncbi:LacI family DNA-binding transcriptional regulator [Lactiplantibacillus nangangensis]|uniref:LacI family DNA-binding transcriptional regulator n=1 Tax=Lactiplantibacillus nangangensis TaxID=2559917 RepID=A0ABW1SMS5_9LACO|nr:LacI family DNA-binding transcriptional regulator [Lactiplantibacillus nangangensis]
MKKATIKDVARLAQVSISTVSNALNGVNVVKPQTKARVLKAAHQLNYSPNLMGRQLRSGQTNTIGVFTDSVAGPYFYQLIETISKTLADQHYGMSVTLANNHTALMNGLLGNTCDGAIIFDHRLDDRDLEHLAGQGIPVVMLDRPVSGEQLSSIVFDSFNESYLATQYLLQLGHRQLGYLAGYDHNRDNHERFAGFKQAILNAGLSLADTVVLKGLFEEKAAFQALQTYLATPTRQPVSAFLAGNDLSALGAIKAITAAGYKVPNDYSVIGFDDIEMASYFQPALTTVRNPITQQAQLAVKELVGLLTTKARGQQQVLPGKLIVRSSTAKFQN